jgi:hypothetical protein
MARQQVHDLVTGLVNVCRVAQRTCLQITQKTSPGHVLNVATAAAGLGLLAGLSLWKIPPDVQGCSEEAVALYKAEMQSSSSNGSEDAGQDSSSSSSGSLSSLQAKQTQQQAAVLQAYALQLMECDVADISDVLGMLGKGATEPQDSSSSSSSSKSSSWHGALPRVRLLQLMREHCSITLSAAAAAAAGEASAAAETEPGSSGSVTLALWRLLLAVKPSVAAALHCSSLPAACRSYEAFERAVLAWPPQQAAAGDATQQQQQQQQDDSGSSNCSNTCSCGQPGLQYSFVTFCSANTDPLLRDLSEDLAAALAAAGTPLVSYKPTTRVVCAEPACVGRELQQLAQQGPPVAFQDEEVLSMAISAVRQDLLLLPDEYR